MRISLPASSRTLSEGWTFAGSEPNAIEAPGPALDALPFEPAQVPGTVAAELRARGRLDLSNPPDLDALDHWYRCTLPRIEAGTRTVLVFEGLATLADVFIGDTLVLRTDNMYRTYELDISAFASSNPARLSLCFRALHPRLKAARPRPRWRTRITDFQQLRLIRTTLLGRTPGFCPRVAPVGPFRAIRIETRPEWARLRAGWRAAVEPRGRVELEFALELEGPSAELPRRACLELSGPAVHTPTELELTVEPSSSSLRVQRELDSVELWWPHTHGAQPLADVRLRLGYPHGDHLALLGRVGFRKLERDPSRKGLALVVNDVPIFCRGACFATDDLVTLGEARDPFATLRLARAAGMNMIRVGGTTVYPSDRFLSACDELGILLFQDFMFANMDYPAGDDVFIENVRDEVREVLDNLQGRPAISVLCGSSEVEQQAAMLGVPREHWSNALFENILPELCAALLPDVPYVPSSPSGGALPFSANAAVTHYYGVGAYLRPTSDARLAAVEFASECLAFANVPEEPTLEAFLRDFETPPHHPRWKERVPRDRGVGWDFDDVRDHYVAELFKVDPARVRASDVGRYLALGRAATAEIMERVLSEWRRPGSTCRGALVWQLQDYWPGAGWGVIDALGAPKAAYYGLARALSPVALLLTNEGLNGFALHALNDTNEPLHATLEVALYRDGKVRIATGSAPLELAAQSGASLSADAVLGAFYDTTYAYRFGPPSVDLLVARLVANGGARVLGRAFGFPLGLPADTHADLELRAAFARSELAVDVWTSRHAAFVTLDVPGFRPEDNYFHLAPGERRRIALSSLGDGASPSQGSVSALNWRISGKIERDHG